MTDDSSQSTPAPFSFFPPWGWLVVCAAGALSFLISGPGHAIRYMMLAAMLSIVIAYLRVHGSKPIASDRPASFRIMWWTIGTTIVASAVGVIVSGSWWGILLGFGSGALGGFCIAVIREAQRDSIQAKLLRSKP